MAATLELRRAILPTEYKEGDDEPFLHPGTATVDRVVLREALTFTADGAAAIDKTRLALAAGLGPSDEDEEGFEMESPTFSTYVQVDMDYDNFFVTPVDGWKRSTRLELSVEVARKGVRRGLVGTVEVSRPPALSSFSCLPISCARATACCGDKATTTRPNGRDIVKPLIIERGE